jgi:ABC-2 type transport system ATP-binding protein
MEIIKVQNLTKRYSYYEKEKGITGSLKNLFHKKKLYKEAVRNLNLTINQGDIIGFIGLNGAGKTTTLKMMSGILKPTSGNIEILGFYPFNKDPEFLKQITMVMGNKSQLWWDLPSIETFELNRQIYDVNKKSYNNLLNELVDILNVGHLLNIQVRRLSLGERMKMELIASLIHLPSVMFLDEPTIGLDVISQNNILQFLKEYNKKHKTTIILTSHNFDDIVYLCDRLLLIDKGEIIYDNSLDNFLKKYSRTKTVTIKYNHNKNTSNFLIEGNFNIIDDNAEELKLLVNEDEVIAINHQLMINYYHFIKDISVENMDIKEIIKNIYS